MTSTTSRFAYHGGTEAVIAPEEIRMSEQAFQPLLYAISADVVKRLVAGGMSLGDALVFGNESSGLPKDFYDRYKESLFKIPMPGEHARSINLANAVSIAAYECYRQLSGT